MIVHRCASGGATRLRLPQATHSARKLAVRLDPHSVPSGDKDCKRRYHLQKHEDDRERQGIIRLHLEQQELQHS
jgi:hypothetical protein